MADRARRPLASVFVEGLEEAWLVAETPPEIAALTSQALENEQAFIALTLANPDEEDEPRWNGRTVYVLASRITGIAPPLSTEDKD